MEAIKEKVNNFTTEIVNDVYDFLGKLEYQDSSRVSYIIDKALEFQRFVNEIELSGK